jgi:hypothetical protein
MPIVCISMGCLLRSSSTPYCSGVKAADHPIITSYMTTHPFGFLGYFFSPAVKFVTTVSGGADA